MAHHVESSVPQTVDKQFLEAAIEKIVGTSQLSSIENQLLFEVCIRILQ